MGSQEHTCSERCGSSLRDQRYLISMCDRGDQSFGDARYFSTNATSFSAKV